MVEYLASEHIESQRCFARVAPTSQNGNMSEFDIGFITCPVCGQEILAGDPFWDHRDLQKERQKVIRELHGKGFSYRQIMKVVNLKSTRSISMALGK